MTSGTGATVHPGAKIYYHTGFATNDPTDPPFFDFQDPLNAGNGWQDYAANPPANPSDVRWVAFYNPCISSEYFPTTNTGDICWNPTGIDPDTGLATGAPYPSRFTGQVKVQVNPLPDTDVCAVYKEDNWGVFTTHNQTDNLNSTSTNNDATTRLVDITDVDGGLV
ncbi:MAG: hypothetical protein H6546_06995 [Chitinophagales bacterium]|nr:hypothetical protein [Chitinophagales bacterium]